ncbi:hypothetical protein SAMN04488553_1245 [Gramella sp. MAR_2010_147]|nr:hypothetical protein SAMN04488553_1245 [Gramella sp. MAR_2010_147]
MLKRVQHDVNKVDEISHFAIASFEMTYDRNVIVSTKERNLTFEISIKPD